jgi:transposase-like protein
MRRRRNLTEAEKAYAAQEREKGRTLESIADEIGCSRGSIEWYCLLVGADTPRPRSTRETPKEPRVIMRKGRPMRFFTEEEDRQIIAMSIDGKTDTEIGRAIGRRSHSIRGRLATLARREARAENEHGVAA